VRGRAQGLVFGLLCAGGAAAALGLLVQEAGRTPPVQARVLATTRSGLTTVVQVDVRSSTAAPRCVQLRVAAQDREGRDLASSPTRTLELSSRGSSLVSAELTLTPRQYDEQLARVRAVLDSCSGKRHAQK